MIGLPNLLQHHNLKYILFYKFQTDYSYGRFDLYRRGLTVNDIIASFSGIKTDKQDFSFIKIGIQKSTMFMHC